MKNYKVTRRKYQASHGKIHENFLRLRYFQNSSEMHFSEPRNVKCEGFFRYANVNKKPWTPLPLTEINGPWHFNFSLLAEKGFLFNF